MFNLLATSPFLNYFRAYYEVLGGLGLVAGFIFFAVLVVCSFSRKGAYFLFFLFLIASMLSASDKEAVARTAAISVFRYMLLFPIAFWGIISIFFQKKRVGLIGWLSLIYCLLHIPGWMLNDFGGTARLIGQLMLWFAVVGFLSPDLTNIEGLKRFLQRMGWLSWVLVGIAVGFILASPGQSFAGGRLQSLWARPNAFAISMFFAVIILAYRIFLMDGNYFRTLDMVCLFAAMIMILMSGTRAAGVATAIVLLPFIRGKSFKYYLLTFFLLIVFLGVVVTVPDLQKMAVDRFIPTSEMDTAGRAERWEYGWQMVLRKPVFGYGLVEVLDMGPAFVHNSFISIALVGGLTTMAVFVLACLVGVWESIGKANQQYYLTDRKVCHHVLFSILAILFISFFESITVGIGGAGVTIILLLLYCANSLVPVWYEEQEVRDEYNDEYQPCEVETI